MIEIREQFIRALLDEVDGLRLEARKWKHIAERTRSETVPAARVAELERHVELFLGKVPFIGPSAHAAIIDLRNAIKAFENDFGDWQAKKAEEA